MFKATVGSAPKISELYLRCCFINLICLTAGHSALLMILVNQSNNSNVKLVSEETVGRWLTEHKQPLVVLDVSGCSQFGDRFVDLLAASDHRCHPPLNGGPAREWCQKL